MEPGLIPQTLDELTPEWLTGILHDQGVLGGARVIGYESEFLKEGSVARIRDYCFCPETLTEIATILGFTVRLRGYRLPLDAARSLMWMDLMMWNAACQPHIPPFPTSHFAPNLDVFATFHQSAAGEEWLLCDAHAPVGREGLIGCSGRIWSTSGRLIASGASCLFCRPNPEFTAT